MLAQQSRADPRAHERRQLARRRHVAHRRETHGEQDEDIAERTEHAHDDHRPAERARFERDALAIAPCARREHQHAKRVAGEVDEERRYEQHLHGPAVIERVRRDQHARQQPVQHADARRTPVMPDESGDQQDSADDQQHAEQRARRDGLAQQPCSAGE
jgi:hypothetical protein